MQKRFEELDLLRGLAIICMVGYHVLFILNFFSVMKVNLYFPLMEIFVWLVRFDFLALVGAGMVISYYRILAKGYGRGRAILQQWKRGVMVGGCALLVTLATYWYVPEDFVRFGILHLIAVSIFFWSFFVEWKWVVLVLSLVSFWLGGWFAWMGVVGVDFTSVIVGNFNLGYFLRDMLWTIQSVDYFPLFPWLGMVGMGIFLGQIFYPKGVRRTPASVRGETSLSAGSKREVLVSACVACGAKLKKSVCFLGRHSLLIYMIHVPLIMVVLWVMGLVKV